MNVDFDRFQVHKHELVILSKSSTIVSVFNIDIFPSFYQKRFTFRINHVMSKQCLIKGNERIEVDSFHKVVQIVSAG